MSEKIIVIPARIGSKRFPKKMLFDIQGKTLIEWTVEAAKRVKETKIYVATDDDEIAKRVKETNVKCIMTPKNIKSGTERVSYLVDKIDFKGKIINWQGDEPLVKANHINKLFTLLDSHDIVTLATLYKGDLKNTNRVKANINSKMQAIDFSRNDFFVSSPGKSPSGKTFKRKENWDTCWEHVGIYGYKSPALKKWTSSKISRREKKEKLEQLTALEIGLKIGVHIIDNAPIGINTIEDVKKIDDLTLLD
ncbi:3-deoxy-manno-octulosonate cytidylyltransferase [bacterium]|nr:3-deoxy-manno-octulosonate cytidylyltransferase [bacterium]|tara:strand:+ start:33118 stop:33867 length:750 start_codon:yes stop_codon:yes gene_type:complete